MGRFAELAQYKQDIAIKLISNDNLLKALTNNQINFLDYPAPKDPALLFYKHIYPYKPITSKFNESKAYITMSFVNFKPVNRSHQIKEGDIYFYIICAESLMRTDYGLRTDYIVNQIDELFNDIRGIGLGKLELGSMSDIQIGDGYLGAVLSYHVTEFM